MVRVSGVASHLAGVVVTAAAVQQSALFPCVPHILHSDPSGIGGTPGCLRHADAGAECPDSYLYPLPVKATEAVRPYEPAGR